MSDIINPYIAGSPLSGPEMFFGREDVFDFIRKTLIGQHRDNVIVLYGQRRTGKTSVLYQMHSQLDTRYLCILMDLHGFALEGLDGFLWELTNHILRVLHRDHQIDLPRLNRTEFIVDPRRAFEDEFLSRVWSAIGNRHILLMLDEAIRLQDQVQAGKMEHVIFEYMRHLMQHYERLNFLFSLGSGLEEMEKEYTFLFNVGLYKQISFLDRNAAINLITQPVKECYQVESDALDRILQITSGHPYYTQLLCHSLFNRGQQQQHIRVEDVDEVLDEVVERGLAVLKHVWEESNPEEKAIVAGMAATTGEHNVPVDANHINRTWSRYDIVLPKGEMAKAIQGLVTRDVIVGQDKHRFQDKYRFTVDLQRLWVQKYKRLEWVKEEIADSMRNWSSSTKPAHRGIHWPTNLSRPIAILLVGLMFVLVGSVAYLSFNANQLQYGLNHIRYPSIDNIPCDPKEKLSYHIHLHLSIYINNQPVIIPANIGIVGVDPTNPTCFYWVHTHFTDGVIHIESPKLQTYKLGNFLHIWDQFPTTHPAQLDEMSGWLAYVNGQPYHSDFHNILLEAHILITLAYSSPKITPDTIYNWNGL